MKRLTKCKKGLALTTMVAFISGTAALVAVGEWVTSTQEHVSNPGVTVSGWASSYTEQATSGLLVVQDISETKK